MKEFILSNINTSISCYNRFVQLYNDLQNSNFENIHIRLENWFGANMCAVLGGILDSLSSTNEISVTSKNRDILLVLQRNNFLANYGYNAYQDINNTTIKYLKLNIDLSDIQRSILKQMVSFPESSIEEIAKALGTKPESIRYQRRLMQDKVVTEKIGSNKNGRWKITFIG